MPYPQQTNQEEIKKIAFSLLEEFGEDYVTIRGVAKELHISPNAIYRYYENKQALLADLSAMGALLLLRELKENQINASAPEPIYNFASTYFSFAANHPHLYNLMMSDFSYTQEQNKQFQNLWNYIKSLASLVTSDVNEGAVAIWGYLHGMVGLNQSGVFQRGKSQEGVQVGLAAMVHGFSQQPKME